jgi:imidazolonepropionase-like amidohydrolase
VYNKRIIMKKIILAAAFFLALLTGRAQETIYPAEAQKETIALVNATIHVGNGQVINNGTVVFSNGKIVSAGVMANTVAEKTIDCSGKHIYPGIIESISDLGLIEIGAVRSTRDVYELGELNPNIRSVIAYNTDSKVINTLRSNGVLLANIVPQGGIISGSSSVVQLDAWNWEDAAYKMDGGLHFRMPSLVAYPTRFGGKAADELLKDAYEKIDNVRTFFRQAKAYQEEIKHEHTNIKFESVKGLFDKSKTFFVHCNLVKEMMIAIDFAKEFGFRTVIVGGADSWMITDYLIQNNIAVILNAMHNLPLLQDDDVSILNKAPYLLQQAGVLYSIEDEDNSTRGRNLMFNAGVAVAYGLNKEQALQAITLNAAKILGIDDRTGSIEKGKDANIVISEGDILDMRSSMITDAFIQGRKINLENKQTQLYERYKYKYGLK